MGRLFALALCWASLSVATQALARKTNQPVYETPFDIGAGGASLTFAAKEGRLFSNPALLPHGGRFHQWFGSTTTLVVNKESIDTVRTAATGGGSSNTGAADGTADTGGDGEYEHCRQSGFQNTHSIWCGASFELAQ